MTPTLTPESAINILHVAQTINMFPEGAMPESDKDKLDEAGKIVELAEQQAKIVASIGEWNVPAPQVAAMKEVLAHAGLPYGESPSNGEVAEQPPQPPAQAPVPAPQPEPTPVPSPAPEPQLAPEPPPAPAPDPPAAEAPPVAPEGFADKPDEFWLDAEGNTWKILEYEGGPQVKAAYVGTWEITVLPAGFLKQRTDPPVETKPSEQPLTPLPEVNTAAAGDTVHPQPVPGEPAQPELPPAQPTMPPPPPTPEGTHEGEAAGSGGEEFARHAAQQLVVPEDDDEGDDAYANVLAKVREIYTPQAMPAPMDLERPPQAMPDDLTAVQDPEARRLHSQFNALASRVRYLHGLESAKARACDRLYRHHLKGAMREARSQLGKDASVTEVQQLAEDHEVVASWLDRKTRHTERAEAYKVFLSIYAENVTVLSRDWTMRAAEEAGS